MGVSPRREGRLYVSPFVAKTIAHLDGVCSESEVIEHERVKLVVERIRWLKEQRCSSCDKRLKMKSSYGLYRAVVSIHRTDLVRNAAELSWPRSCYFSTSYRILMSTELWFSCALQSRRVHRVMMSLFPQSCHVHRIVASTKRWSPCLLQSWRIYRTVVFTEL